MKISTRDTSLIEHKIRLTDNYNQEIYNNVDFKKLEEIQYFLEKNNPEFIQNFELVEYLDSGSTGIVYKGKTADPGDNRLYSFKFFFQKNKKKKRNKSKYNEIIIQKKLHYKYIAQILAFSKLNDEDFFSVSELGKYGNLDNFLHRYLKRDILSETFINYIAKQILEALNYMHRKKLYHMDLKKGNIVLDSELNIKLIDYSSTISFGKENPNTLYVFPKIGTGRYMSPELMNRTNIEIKYGEKLDIFSLGVTLYNLAFGCYPYGLSNIKGDDYNQITEKLNNEPLEFPKNIEISRHFQNFLRKVLEKDYLKRYNTREALEDPWIKGWDIINEEKENTGILENFIIKLITDNIPKFNQYIK